MNCFYKKQKLQIANNWYTKRSEEKITTTATNIWFSFLFYFVFVCFFSLFFNAEIQKSSSVRSTDSIVCNNRGGVNETFFFQKKKKRKTEKTIVFDFKLRDSFVSLVYFSKQEEELILFRFQLCYTTFSAFRDIS